MSKFINSIGKMMNKVMLSCDDATLLITRSDYEALSSIKQFKLKMHLAACSMCRNYKHQSSIITSQINILKKGMDKTKVRVVLNEDLRTQIQCKINNELKKH